MVTWPRVLGGISWLQEHVAEENHSTPGRQKQREGTQKRASDKIAQRLAPVWTHLLKFPDLL